ncbi:MAG: IS110 family transposase, partial [Acidimicrobiales bacterium]
MIFVGDDWAEDHQDIHVMDDTGRRLVSRRLPEGLEGIARLHEPLAGLADDADVVVGIETDRGLWVGAVAASGYQVYSINALAVARYRDRDNVAGAKSDAGDAKVLADRACGSPCGPRESFHLLANLCRLPADAKSDVDQRPDHQDVCCPSSFVGFQLDLGGIAAHEG